MCGDAHGVCLLISGVFGALFSYSGPIFEHESNHVAQCLTPRHTPPLVVVDVI